VKSAVFYDVAPCGSYKNRRFGGRRRLHLHGSKTREREKCWTLLTLLSLAYLFTLKMEATRSSETSVLTRSTQGHIPESGILHPGFCLTFETYVKDVGLGLNRDSRSPPHFIITINMFRKLDYTSGLVVFVAV
jgi:hypothetical protein